MTKQLESMTGHELLLLAVLGGASLCGAVDKERRRRAVHAVRCPHPSTGAGRVVVREESPSGRLVA